MIIKPYADRKRRTMPVALADSDGIAWDATGGPSDGSRFATYIDVDSARDLIARSRGTGIYWENRLIQWESPDGVTMRVLPHDGESPVSFADRLRGLIGWVEWLESYGVSVASPQEGKPPASIGSASMRLLKASLRRILFCSGPERELPPIHSVIGGRQESMEPGVYEREYTLWDMRAAYASTLARTPYGGWWHRLGRDRARRVDWEAVTRAGVPAFVNAVARYGPLVDIGPLPRRPPGRRDHVMANIDPTYYPTEGVMQGTWTAAEFVAASKVGVSFRILDAWKHYGDSSYLPFAGWWERIEEGRGLEGYAGQLAKITGNSLIGQFHIDPRGVKRRVWFDGRKKYQRRMPRAGSVRPAFDLAETVTGTVRARLFAEALWPHAGRVLAAHTDGAWIAGTDAPRGQGWRVVDRAEVVDLLDSQHLAYRRPGDPVTRYKLAGSPAETAERSFDEQWDAQFGPGGIQRRTRAFEHIEQSNRDYRTRMQREGLL